MSWVRLDSETDDVSLHQIGLTPIPYMSESLRVYEHFDAPPFKDFNEAETFPVIPMLDSAGMRFKTAPAEL